MPRPKLVIFDCDGVLVDTEPVSCAALAANLRGYGLDLTTEDCLRLFTGWSMLNIRPAVEKMGAVLPDNWIDEVYSEEFAALKQGVEAIPGIPEVLDRLEAAGIPFCVASNGSEAKMQITLGLPGLYPRFDGAIFSAHSLRVSKPDPALFQAALAAFSIPAHQAIVVEDSPLGATGAARAGIPCLGYAPHGDGATLAAAGATIFKDMSALPALLGI
ncbi:MAG: haloacid dehalogenase [Sneathiella sp.]|jgi:HAD superfamily hydrolase (TIGR01509 family)|uniref:HAD family hydrolase n=1 Tax=Sneathiella sp. TaxID=1964365 RepID=UPI000C638390|nr:HAD family phosphatase [Sneathiella sp.]MAL79276.1 haloacid dehalogenase [Sneathiella sp.]